MGKLRKKDRDRIEYYEGRVREAVESLGRYRDGYGLAIRQLAVELALYDSVLEALGKDITVEEVSREGNPRLNLNPAFNVLGQLGEQIRKLMRDLGLVVAKPAGYTGVERVDPARTDTLTAMLEDAAGGVPKLYRRAKA